MKWLLLTTSLISSLQSSDACSASKDATAPPDGQQKDPGAPPNGNVTGPAVNPNNPTSPGQTQTPVLGNGATANAGARDPRIKGCNNTCLSACSGDATGLQDFLHCGPKMKGLHNKPNFCCKGQLEDPNVHASYKCEGNTLHTLCKQSIPPRNMILQLRLCLTARKSVKEKAEKECEGVTEMECFDHTECIYLNDKPPEHP